MSLPLGLLAIKALFIGDKILKETNKLKAIDIKIKDKNPLKIFITLLCILLNKNYSIKYIYYYYNIN